MMISLLRDGTIVCIVLQVMGCGPDTAQDQALLSESSVVAPPTNNSVPELPASPQTSAQQKHGAGRSFRDVENGAELRRLLSDRQLRLGESQSTPTLVEIFNADGTWAGYVQMRAMTSVEGTWRIVEMDGARPQVCVAQAIQNGTPLVGRDEVCRVVSFSEQGRMAKTSDLFHTSITSTYDVGPIDEIWSRK